VIAIIKEKAMAVLSSFEKYFNKLLNITLYLCGTILLFTTLFTTLDIIARSTGMGSVSWTVEVSEILMLWITFFSAAWLYFTDGHINFEIVYERLPIKIMKIVDKIADTVSLFTVAIFSYFSYIRVIDMIRRNVVYRSMLSIPGWLIYGPVLLGCILLLIACALRLFIPRSEDASTSK
jgi:TRAP-type C4-dicarboxylate transport system permease small subunit